MSVDPYLANLTVVNPKRCSYWVTFSSNHRLAAHHTVRLTESSMILNAALWIRLTVLNNFGCWACRLDRNISSPLGLITTNAIIDFSDQLYLWQCCPRLDLDSRVRQPWRLLRLRLRSSNSTDFNHSTNFSNAANFGNVTNFSKGFGGYPLNGNSVRYCDLKMAPFVSDACHLEAKLIAQKPWKPNLFITSSSGISTDRNPQAQLSRGWFKSFEPITCSSGSLHAFINLPLY